MEQRVDIRSDGSVTAHAGMHVNDRPPNFYSPDGEFHLVRCYACSKYGTENHAFHVRSGACWACGWSLEKELENG
jgi:hypothetical protein